MIQEVVSVDLPVHERLVIKKNRLEPENMTGKEKRISIVTGTHGDELDGQYICYEIIKKIHMYPEKLKGIVDTPASRRYKHFSARSFITVCFSFRNRQNILFFNHSCRIIF